MPGNRLDIDSLIDSVSNDGENSRTKQAAELLVTAMNDWLTFNQKTIVEFVSEFKNDYGNDPTIENLNRKITSEAWKEESKSSIIDMLELFPSHSFSEIIEDIINRYC
jgi:sulfur relay (sulfurtransferase) DsrC/TusE family protein